MGFHLRKIRVVLADDHQLMRRALHSVLQDEIDIVVVGEADDGFTASKIVGELEPDVLVLNLAMRVENGIDAVASISMQFPKTRIVALSGYSESQPVQALLKAGAIAHVVKAAFGWELVRAVRLAAPGNTCSPAEVTSNAAHHLQLGKGAPHPRALH